jgi:hypothetical protein
VLLTDVLTVAGRPAVALNANAPQFHGHVDGAEQRNRSRYRATFKLDISSPVGGRTA